jgi:hypothetical protein
MNDDLKRVLLAIVSELENLRTNDVMLARRIDLGSGLLDAAKEKIDTVAGIDPDFAELKKTIEAL